VARETDRPIGSGETRAGSGDVEAARRRLVEAYRLREPIVEPTLEAAEAYLSIGEMVAALAEVSGEAELRKRGGFITRLY